MSRGGVARFSSCFDREMGCVNLGIFLGPFLKFLIFSVDISVGYVCDGTQRDDRGRSSSSAFALP